MTNSLTNREISRQFRLFAELLLIHGQDERLADLLSGAAYRLQRMETEVVEGDQGAWSSSFRPEVAKLIKELVTTGTLQGLDELVQLTPAGLYDMMRIKGLGGKKLHILWKKAKIDNIEQLLAAAESGALRKLSGFAKKTEENLVKAIGNLNETSVEFHYADVAAAANLLVTHLQKVLKTTFVSLCGEVRRRATTVSRIEIITLPFPRSVKAAGLKKILHIATRNGNITEGYTPEEIPVTIYHATAETFIWQLFERTGNAEHVGKVSKKIRRRGSYKEESEIYKAAKLPFIVPEMREDLAEWEYAKRPRPLIEVDDIRGVVHNHTTWSDGVDRLEDFVAACRRKKFEYVVISDHSKNAHYAGGLKEEKVLRQLERIDELNEQMKPFRILSSIECDILVNGDLDFPKALLKKFDLVIVSVHQQLKMTEEKATARVIRAIENPATTILGHMTGRQLLVRPGYPLNFKKVIDACASNDVIIEINANPYRLDMDWSHLPYALKKGVMISIDPDAHSIPEIDNIQWGVAAARKGGLTKEATWNAMPLKGVEEWLRKHRKI